MLFLENGNIPIGLLNSSSRIAMVDIDNKILETQNLNVGEKILIELFEDLSDEVVISHLDNTNFAFIIGAQSDSSVYSNFSAAISRDFINAVLCEPTQQHYYFLIYINKLGSHLLFEVPPENINTIIHTPGLDEVSAVDDDLRSEDLSGDETAQHATVQSFIEILEWQTFYLINDERTIHNLNALKMDNLVHKMARACTAKIWAIIISLRIHRPHMVNFLSAWQLIISCIMLPMKTLPGINIHKAPALA